MNFYYRRKGQMDLTDRLAIETGLCRGESFKKIAQTIMRHPSTVAHEVLENRTHIKATYELIPEDDEDMHALYALLKMDLIPPDEVHLMPDLFSKNR